MATRTHLIEKGVAVLRHAMISAHANRVYLAYLPERGGAVTVHSYLTFNLCSSS